MPEAADSAPAYEPKSTIDNASKAAFQAGIVGLVLSSIQNALGKHSHGAMGILTRTGGTVGFFAAMGGTFAFAEAFIANERRKNDAVNGAAGGCAAGFLAGLKSRSIPVGLAGCVLLGGAMGGYDYAGGMAGDPLTKEERRNRFFKTPPKPLIDPTSSE